MKVTRHHISLPLQYPLSVFAEAEAEVVSGSDFDACAEAAVELAKTVQKFVACDYEGSDFTHETIQGVLENDPDYQRAQTVIDQYGGQS